jgi:CubicO group peptidase (beta-lactamase class C family)
MTQLKNITRTFGLFCLLISFHCHAQTDQDKLRSLSNEITKIVRDTRAVGVSVALIDNYEVVWSRGFGTVEIGKSDSVTTETLFQIASITKSVTATLVMKKIQEGAISLTDDANKQLTSWQIPKNDFTAKSTVTVKQLLSHTAGVANSHYRIDGYQLNDKLPTVIESLNGVMPAENEPVEIIHEPGTVFSYSNCGYWILEALLEDVSQEHFKEIVTREILKPLGMDNSTFEIVPQSHQFKSVAVGHLEKNRPIDQKYYVIRPLSSGGLWSTPTDIAKFLIEIQLSIQGKSNKVISEQSAKLMVKPVMGQYGLGFTNEIRGTGVKFFGHDGHNLGYISSMIGSLDKGFGVVIMTNSENGWKAVNKIKKIVGRKFWGF